MSIGSLLTEIAVGWVEAKRETFAEHPLAIRLRTELVAAVSDGLGAALNGFRVKASAGAGNWADVPWLAILEPSITTSTQSGIYPVYLFCADGSGVYLSLGFGTTELTNTFGVQEAQRRAGELRISIRAQDPRLESWGNDIDLRANTALGRSYEWASAGAKFYPSDGIPEDKFLLEDLEELLAIYSDIKLESTEDDEAKRTITSRLLSKPFLLLAGISGTGKTRFVREQVQSKGVLTENYCLTPVRPDWHEPSDLLGYVSHLKGEAKYISTDVIEFIAKAWRAIIDSDLLLIEKTADNGEIELVVKGDKNALVAVLPYWLCLDEMNLAPIEQYFADYLSVIETRSWQWTGGDFTYGCDALLSASTLSHTDYSDCLRTQLGFEGDEYDTPWQLFKRYGMGVPFNLIVAGTVNMDETTHGFSRKVIDRALSFDFGEFFPNDVDEFFEAKKLPVALSYPIYSQAKRELFKQASADSDVAKTKAFFNAINHVLKGTAFELAFRAFNELCLSVISFAPENDEQLAAVFDDFLMCKVLPRIEGDEDKLTNANGDNVLDKLTEVVAIELGAVWEGDRIDYFRQNKVSETSDAQAKVISVACRSKSKLAQMQVKVASGFTSFWP